MLCLLTNDLPDVTQKLCHLIEERVKLALSGIIPLANIDVAIRHEMSLLESLLGQYDSGWEIKLKTVLKLFILAARYVFIFTLEKKMLIMPNSNKLHVILFSEMCGVLHHR